jgi:2-hydroxyacyl-CoA lyase 1
VTSDWWTTLIKKKDANAKTMQSMFLDDSVPLTYHRVLKELKDQLPRDVVIVNEGANTLDMYPT